MRAVVLAIAGLSVASDARAEWRVGLGGARIAGHAPSDQIDGAAVRLGAEYRFYPAFGLGPEVAFIQLSGFRDGAANTARGIAATYVARWYALRAGASSLYGLFGFGGVAFDAPFPRAGTRLDGTSLWGVGATLGLGERGWLRLEARQLHASNGKGLVPDNPAYDGLELGVHLAIAPAPAAASRSGLTSDPGSDRLRIARLELFAGARADGYSTVTQASAAIAGVHASLEARLAARLAAQLDLLGGAFSDGEPASAAAGRLYYRDARTALGVSIGGAGQGDRLAGASYSGFVERYEDATLLVSVGVGYEHARDTEDRWFGELFLHLYPSERWLVVAGASYAEAAIKQTRADITMHVEYAAWQLGGTTLAGYLQYGGNLLTRASTGLVLYLDTVGYARRERTRGVHGLRFK